MSATDLPRCADRYCKNKARYKVRRGLDGPEMDVCGSHRNLWERMNKESLRREDTELRREAGTILMHKLTMALKDKAGIEIVRQIGVQPSAHNPALVVSYVDAQAILDWIEALP